MNELHRVLSMPADSMLYSPGESPMSSALPFLNGNTLSILLQLEQAIGPGTMLQMLLASVCVFVIGYYVAAYAG